MHTAHNAVLVQADNLVISGGNFQQNVQVEPGTIYLTYRAINQH